MKVQEDQVIGSKDNSYIIKGKRTKRTRPSSPLALTMATTSSSTSSGGASHDYSGGFDHIASLTFSPAYSFELPDSSTKEEEDMANCLILLAQGQRRKSSQPASSATASKSAGLYLYQCKTCNRCFPSFQALGGHRASHKKPKATNIDDKKPPAFQEENDQLIKNDNNTTLSLQIPIRVPCSNNNNNNKSNKLHECSICGAEFNSGQALGGHMRRHRPIPVPGSSGDGDDSHSQEVKKPRNVLSLDLNLPAPEEDRHRESKIPFALKEQVIVFSASPLVDCHY